MWSKEEVANDRMLNQLDKNALRMVILWLFSSMKSSPFVSLEIRRTLTPGDCRVNEEFKTSECMSVTSMRAEGFFGMTTKGVFRAFTGSLLHEIMTFTVMKA